MFDPPHRVASWPSEGGVELVLYRKPNPGGVPVLLLHGASARHETFTLPRPFAGAARSLTDWLHERGFDPWLLDWRGSARVVDEARSRGLSREAWQSFDLDRASACDLDEALGVVARTAAKDGARDAALGIVGHCMGAAVVAQAIAQGTLDRRLPELRVCLLTLGLFYEAPAESQLRSQDPLLERLLGSPEARVEIDPRPGAAWPSELAALYENLPVTARHRAAEAAPLSTAEQLCNRVSFLYGRPYLEGNLFSTLHHDVVALTFARGRAEPTPGDVVRGVRSGAQARLVEVIRGVGEWACADCSGVLLAIPVGGTFEPGEEIDSRGRRIATCVESEAIEAELPAQFGAIPLRLYVHAWRNLRRGWAASFDAGDDDRALVGDEARARFGRLGRLLLLTGERNSLWHRRSIDRMYDWVVRGPGGRALPVTRRVLRGYGHQDLLWGRRAAEEVFPSIERALRA